MYNIRLHFNETIFFSTNFFNKNNQLDLLKSNLVPDQITIQEHLYKLKCIINFKPPNIESGIGHYQAYCRSPLGVWEVYDNTSSKVLKINNFVIPHLFIFRKEN